MNLLENMAWWNHEFILSRLTTSYPCLLVINSLDKAA